MKLQLLLILLALFSLFGCLAEETSYNDIFVDNAGHTPQEYSKNAESKYIIQESRIKIEVKQGSLEEQFLELRNIIESQDAQVSNIQYGEYENTKQYLVVIKVEPARFEGLNERLKNLGEIRDISVQLEDVKKEYMELEVRIENKEKELDRLLELYEKSRSIDELLEVEREIARVETELEIFKKQEKNLISKVEHSQIEIIMYENKPSSEQLAVPVESMGLVFFSSLSTAITLITAIFGFLLPFMAITLPIWLIYKKYISKKSSKPRKPEHSRIPPLPKA